MPGRQPNVVICLCDMLRAQEIGCYGHPSVRTPNMDRLAEEGPWFEVGVSNSPLCVPARSVLLTGQYARTCTGTNGNYVGFPPSRRRGRCTDPTLAEVLRDAGYRTALIGKWHLHPAPDLVGFDSALFPHNFHEHYGQQYFDLDGNMTVVDEFAPWYEVEQARRYVRRHKDRPFFLLYSISPPHMPLNRAPERYTKMYSREEVALRDNVFRDGEMTYDRDWIRQYLWDYLGYLNKRLEIDYVPMAEDYEQRKRDRPFHGVHRMLQDVRKLMQHPEAGPIVRQALPYLDDTASEAVDLKDLTALYDGMVTCVDDCLGELAAILDEEGVAEDTLLVFASDHGDMLGSQGLWNKAYIYEESIRIPLMFRRPGQLGARRVTTQVGTLVDVLPTVLSLLDLECPSSAQGTDLRTVLEGREDTVGENVAYIEAYKRQIGARTLTHLYAAPMEGDPEPEWRPAPKVSDHLFFDLRADPYQTNNLAPAGGQAEIATGLRRSLLRWHEATPWKRV